VPGGGVLELWVRRGCAVVVAAVAAYASYEHQRVFALRGGADPAGASLWPLSVDGLLVLATIGLLKPAAQRGQRGRRARVAVRVAFGLGIVVSLAANVAAAPRLAWQPVLVAGWPPVALLLAVELLGSGPGARDQGETAEPPPVGEGSRPETETPRVPAESGADPDRDRSGSRERRGNMNSRSAGAVRSRVGGKAEDAMWEYFQQQRALGRTPSGADLDRAAGTNNYGRAVLARWRRTGRIPDTPAAPPRHRRPAVAATEPRQHALFARHGLVGCCGHARADDDVPDRPRHVGQRCVAS
jgi:hypothetical protein